MLLRIILIALLSSSLLTGCALALEGLAVEGEALALEGLGDVSAAARFAPLDAAASRGILGNALAEVTADGTETAVLSVDQAGIIRMGPRQLAELESTGDIMASNQRVGFVRDGYIYETSQNGGRAVAELHGFIPSRGIYLEPSGAVRILRPNVYVDVLQITNDQYLVRLADGETAWVDPAFAVLLVAGMAHPIPQCPDSSGVLVRQSGELILFDHCSQRDDAFVVDTYEGEAIVDRPDVRTILNDAAQTVSSANAILLTGGDVVYGRAQRQGDVTRIVSDRGVIIADNMRVEPHQPSMERLSGQSVAYAPPSYILGGHFTPEPTPFGCWGCGHLQMPVAARRYLIPSGPTQNFSNAPEMRQFQDSPRGGVSPPNAMKQFHGSSRGWERPPNAMREFHGSTRGWGRPPNAMRQFHSSPRGWGRPPDAMRQFHGSPRGRGRPPEAMRQFHGSPRGWGRSPNSMGQFQGSQRGWQRPMRPQPPKERSSPYRRPF